VGETQRDCDPYREALENPDLLKAVRAVHDGRWAVADALWWASSPDSPTPDGRPAPAARLRELQRRAFAADGDAVGDSAVAQAILDLETEIAFERAAIDAALGVTRGATGGVTRIEAAKPGASAGSETATAAESVTPTAFIARFRRGRVLAVTLAGALTVGAVLGSNLTALLSTATNSGAGSTVIPTGDPVPETDEDVLVGRVFDSVQTPKDIPLPMMPDFFVAESFRYLGSAGWTDVNSDGITDSPYYAARGASGTVCLVVVPADSGYLSTCALEAAYPAAGLRLSWQSRDLHPDTSDPLDEMVLDISVAWLSDATVETRGSGRAMSEP
jgi:hypothetical protein